MLSAKAAHPDDDFFKEERRRLHCPLFGCKRMYSDKDTLKSHVKDHQIHTQSLPGKTFRCSSTGCNRSFPSMQSLMEHGRHHYKPNTFFLCEGCRAKLASYNNLLKHLNNCSKVAKTKTVMPVGQTNTDMNLATAPDRVPGANLDGNANPMPDSVPITPPVTMGSPDSNHHQAPQQTDTAPPPLLSQMDGFLPDPPIGSFSKPDTLMQALQQTLPHLQPQNQTQQQALFQNQTQQQALFQNQTQQQALPQSQQQALPQLQPQNQNQQQALPQLQPQQQAMPQLQPQNQNQQQVLPQLQPLNQPQALPQLQPQNQQQALPQLQPQTQQQPLPQLQPHDQTQSPPPAQQQAEPEGLQEFPTPGSSPQPSPGSNAVWKNPGSSFNCRILWEHTRGRYKCTQCGKFTANRPEMTAHLKSQHKSTASCQSTQ